MAIFLKPDVGWGQQVCHGTDTYDGGSGLNSIVGGWSYDTLHVLDQLSNLQNIQVLDGGDTTWQYNTILATGGNDTLDFSTYQVNNFIIDGSAGNDVITGTAGADHILGGTGNDVLSGGAGDDTFLLLTGSDANGTTASTAARASTPSSGAGPSTRCA